MTGPLPPGYTFAYSVPAEAWYASGGDELYVHAQHDDGGVGWEFAITDRGIGIRAEIYADAFTAFAQIPEFFAALAAEQPTTLDQVRGILDRLGAADITARTGPS